MKSFSGFICIELLLYLSNCLYLNLGIFHYDTSNTLPHPFRGKLTKACRTFSFPLELIHDSVWKVFKGSLFSPLVFFLFPIQYHVIDPKIHFYCEVHRIQLSQNFSLLTLVILIVCLNGGWGRCIKHSCVFLSFSLWTVYDRWFVVVTAASITW